jgi:hypothetical protein
MVFAAASTILRAALFHVLSGELVRRISVVLYLILSVTAILTAQVGSEAKKSVFDEEKWALQFKIDRFFKLSSFQRQGLSLQNNISQTSALRFGIGSNTEDEFIDGEIIDYYESVRCGIQYIHRPIIDYVFIPYFGAGPYLSYYHETWRSNTEYTQWTYGIDGVIGVECFIKRSISVSLEYCQSVSFLKGKDNSEVPEVDSKVSSLSTSEVRLGISAYFNL